MEMETLQKELLHLERQYWQALKNHDTETALSLTDDSCIVTGARGFARLDKQSLANMMQAPNYKVRAYEIADGAEVRMLSDDVAVLAYRVREKLDVDGEPVALEAADSSTWVLRDGGWVCAAHTESLLGDPFGRDRMSVPSGLGA